MNGFVSAAALYGLAVALVPLWFLGERRGWFGASDMPAIAAATLLTALVSGGTGLGLRAVQVSRLDEATQTLAIVALIVAPVLWLIFLGWMSARTRGGGSAGRRRGV
ncbi:MAG: hypothetical protein RIB45_03180 [Marivibrio sp.]|uniref:hypothetical protein n=1 Tax=Marivibrio sp. TaxID=2039719 RepID=UPI0032EBBD73